MLKSDMGNHSGKGAEVAEMIVIEVDLDSHGSTSRIVFMERR